MAEHWTERDRARQQHNRVVVWGCGIHHTPADTECQGCADQGELITWNDIHGTRRDPR